MKSGKKSMVKEDVLRIKPEGEVSDLILDFGSSCGKADPGISMEFEEYESDYCRFENRGGVLTKSQVKKIIKYLQKYVDKCVDRK